MNKKDFKEAVGSIEVPEELRDKIAARLAAQNRASAPKSAAVKLSPRTAPRRRNVWVRPLAAVAALFVLVVSVGYMTVFIGLGGAKNAKSDHIEGIPSSPSDGEHSTYSGTGEEPNSGGTRGDAFSDVYSGKNDVGNASTSKDISLFPSTGSVNGNSFYFWSNVGGKNVLENGVNWEIVVGGSSGNGYFLQDGLIYNVTYGDHGTASAADGAVTPLNIIPFILLPILGTLLVVVTINVLRRRAEGERFGGELKPVPVELAEETVKIEVGETLFVEEADFISLPLIDERGGEIESGATYKIMSYDAERGVYIVRKLV